jgi:YidC/Oxa1 family membrane protein insertase
MNWDNKSFLAIIFCALFYLGYTQYLSKKYPGYGKKPVAETQTEEATPAKETEDPAKTAEATEPTAPLAESGNYEILPPNELRLETAGVIYEFDQTRSALTSVKLKKYNENSKSKPVNLVKDSFVIQGSDQVNQKTPREGFGAVKQPGKLKFFKTAGNFEIAQEFSVAEKDYFLNVDVTFKNISAEEQELTGGLWSKNIIPAEKKSSGFLPQGGSQQDAFVMGVEGDVETEAMKKYCEDESEPAFSKKNETLDFIGYDNHYFLSILQPKEKVSVLMAKDESAKGGNCAMLLTAYQDFGMVGPGEEVKLSFTGFFGPKDVNILRAHDEKLKRAVNFGVFKIIAYPLLVATKLLHKFTANWGVAIILLTLLLKMAFYPLTKAAAVSMKKMQKLQPEMNNIRQKYKEDPRKQQQELMRFMAANKVNPAKGCLPILPQIPVFIAFYNVLSQAIELRHAGFMLWITDLSVKDPYYVTPLVLGGFMFLQQKLTPNTGMDPNQQKIMMMMPIIFTVMMLSLPAGMVLYMITNTVVSICQQQWLNRKLDHRLATIPVRL